MSPLDTSGARPTDQLVAWSFVAVQLALIAAVFFLPGGSDWTAPNWLSTAALTLQVVSTVVLLVAAVSLGRSLTPLPTPAAAGTLRTGGLYRFVRHPIYTGLMGLAIGEAVGSGSVAVSVAALALIGWLMLKARWEERMLADRFEDYREYASRTPRFIPFWPAHR